MKTVALDYENVYNIAFLKNDLFYNGKNFNILLKRNKIIDSL